MSAAVDRVRQEARWAFLAGVGTLSVDEVRAWAAEILPQQIDLPGELDGSEALMVALSSFVPGPAT